MMDIGSTAHDGQEFIEAYIAEFIKITGNNSNRPHLSLVRIKNVQQNLIETVM